MCLYVYLTIHLNVISFTLKSAGLLANHFLKADSNNLLLGIYINYK